MKTDPPPKPPGDALRPRARLLRTLGQELISNEVVALIELVKNSYDADATRVLIRFNGPLDIDHGSIEVLDDGHGMSLETVKTVWMEPATPSKRGKENDRRSERFRRRYLGEKGIGRFASSRLAHELEVISRTSGSPNEVYALFDWRQFDDDEKYLDEIFVLWDERPPIDIKPGGIIEALWASEKKKPAPAQLRQGTVLRMSGLKQKWEAKHFADVHRGLARLISPRAADADNEFHVELALPAEFIEFSSKVEPPTILKHPHYIVRGQVKADGSFNLRYKILSEGTDTVWKGRFVRVKDAKNRYNLRNIDEDPVTQEDEKEGRMRPIECGLLEVALRIWDRDELGNVVQKTHSTVQNIRRDLDAVVGVNIYRDGFRVLPYGEPQDDWLRLDLRRVQNPTLRLSNNQIYGVVEISADTNPALRDQSNREGLDENQAMQDLRDVMISILAHLETLRYEARPRDKAGTTARAAGGLFSGFDLKPLAAYVEQRLPDDKQARELVAQTERAFGGQLKEIQTVLARYQRLATLGQLIDHVLHEGRQPIAAINNEAELGVSDAERVRNGASEFVARARGRFTTIRKQGDVLSIAFKRMEPFGGRRRGRPAQLYLESIIADAFAVFDEDIRRLAIRPTLPKTQTLVRVDPAEIQEVIINLLQNSLHWLQQVREAKREILVKVERKAPDHLDIIFSDSGPGVPRQSRDAIFDPYFTLKPDGIGLGLAIVGEIVTDYYNGSLQLLDHGPLKGATFLITLRKRV